MIISIRKLICQKKSVILADDDEVASFYEIAYPITLKYKVPITSFVIANKHKLPRVKISRQTTLKQYASYIK